MGLMGFVRSGLRENWHIYGVMRDTSAWGFTPTTAVMTQMVGAITMVFLVAVSFLFWLSSLDRKDYVSTDSAEGNSRLAVPKNLGSDS